MYCCVCVLLILRPANPMETNPLENRMWNSRNRLMAFSISQTRAQHSQTENVLTYSCAWSLCSAINDATDALRLSEAIGHGTTWGNTNARFGRRLNISSPAGAKCNCQSSPCVGAYWKSMGTSRGAAEKLWVGAQGYVVFHREALPWSSSSRESYANYYDRCDALPLPWLA